MRLVVAAAAALMMVGCAHSPPPASPPASSQTPLSPLAPVNDVRLREIADSFDLRGKMGAAIDGKGYNARLRWVQQGPVFNMFLSGPIGIGQTQVLGHPGIATVRQGGGEQIFDDPAEALSSAFGFRAPLSELRFWVAGVPAPGPGFTEYGPPEGAVRRFDQSGWQVLVRDLFDTPAGALPKRVTLTRGKTRLKLVLSDWESPSTAPLESLPANAAR